MLAAAIIVTWTTLRRTSPTVRQEARVPIPTVPLSIATSPILGSKSAPVVLVEFSDFQCPFCGRFARETLPQIKAQYVDIGQVQLAFRNFPLSNIHPNAEPAAEAAACAADQRRFWPMHDQLFGRQANLSTDAIAQAAKGAGLDLDVFHRCLAEDPARRIASDEADATKLHVVATPTFFVGRLGQDGRVTVESVISGARPLSDFVAAITATTAKLAH
jgi:protein-disulfide isomerase